jgi:hypothetical protein
MNRKFAQLLFFAVLSLVTGCCSVKPNSLPTDVPGAKPHWHRITVTPGTNAPPVHFYNKLNPIWWVGNASEPRAPDWYKPDRCCRDFQWWLRNPFSNFSSYVIGVADKETVRYGRYPEQTSNPNGGWNFAVTRRCIVYLPFFDYRRGRFEFYFGWRKAGKFGIKLNFYQRVLESAHPGMDATTHRRGFFIWDQFIDPDATPPASGQPTRSEENPAAK